MAESKSAVDVNNLYDYLGRGVDGRTPPETWLDALDQYSREKVRNVHPKEENISVKPVALYRSQSRYKMNKSTTNAEGNFSVIPHPTVHLGGKLMAEHDTSKMWTSHKIRHITKMVVMYDDASKDPGTITRNNSYPLYQV